MNPLLRPLARLAAARSARQQDASGLWDPGLWGAGVNERGHLAVDGVDLPALVAAHGSPLLVVSRRKLLGDAAAFADAVRAAFPDARIAVSYKTNCLPGVLAELHAAGLDAEVISPYELWLANELGVPGGRIVVNGVNKDEAFLRDAVRLGVASVNIDEPEEVPRLAAAARALGRSVRVALRLKVEPGSHFGLDLASGEAAAVARDVAAAPALFDFQGLHFHALADNDDPGPHIAFIRRALAFAAEIRGRFGLPTRRLNVGGGYTVPTMKVMSRFEYARQRLLDVPCRPPDPAAGVPIAGYMAQLGEAVGRLCREHDLPAPGLVFEPGRILFSQSHVLLTRVHAVKPASDGPDFALTDAGKILAAYPCDYEWHQMFVANRMRERPAAAYRLMGRLCTSADWLAKNRRLPRLSPGDTVAVMDAGAYFTSYASNFAFPRPEVVMVGESGIRTLRRRETFEHMTAMDGPIARNAGACVA